MKRLKEIIKNEIHLCKRLFSNLQFIYFLLGLMPIPLLFNQETKKFERHNSILGKTVWILHVAYFSYCLSHTIIVFDDFRRRQLATSSEIEAFIDYIELGLCILSSTIILASVWNIGRRKTHHLYITNELLNQFGEIEIDLVAKFNKIQWVRTSSFVYACCWSSGMMGILLYATVTLSGNMLSFQIITVHLLPALYTIFSISYFCVQLMSVSESFYLLNQILENIIVE